MPAQSDICGFDVIQSTKFITVFKIEEELGLKLCVSLRWYFAFQQTTNNNF
jgi:hypothetical protein